MILYVLIYLLCGTLYAMLESYLVNRSPECRNVRQRMDDLDREAAKTAEWIYAILVQLLWPIFLVWYLFDIGRWIFHTVYSHLDKP